jgi:hypothetical protein
MKTDTKNPTTVLSRATRFLGAMLTLVLMLHTAAVSQSTPVNLGSAANFVALAKSGISTTGVTNITGDIGVSPSAATAITGFGLIMDASNTFSTSSLVTGKIYAADYTPPTPANMTTAINDMQTAYTNAAGRTLPDHTELGAGDITSMTLTPGLYKWGTGVLVSAAGVTISGSATDVWIFQIAQDLTLASGAIVTLSGGAQAANIFWQVAGQATLESTAAMKGNILCQTAIVLKSGATLNGRALAQTAVTLIGNTVVTKPVLVTAVANVVVPQEFALFQNYPNPFNPSTRIQYSLEKATQVSLKVYNLLGHEVATLVNGRQQAGSYTVPFSAIGGSASVGNTSTFASGVYFYRLEAGSFVSTKKLILMK